MKTVSILGCGSRGTTYANAMGLKKDKFSIVSICDISADKLRLAKEKFNISNENLFDDEKVFLEKKRSDVLVIATQDKDHVRQCIRALELGYDILMEKPISPIKEELESLLEVYKNTDRTVMICHVLRYAPAFRKIKALLDEGKVGKLIRLESIEQVAYWHQAHSFVRGNWRNSEQTSPMIMQKCCHDLDLIQYYVNAECDSIYSVGDLSFFNEDNAPKDSASLCAECKYLDTCIYSAENLYIKRWKENGSQTLWPWDVIDNTRPLTEQSLRKAYQEGPYGRCVFKCDNNVVDNQMVAMKFTNGVKATLTMTAFTDKIGRIMIFHGALGEIELNESEGIIRVSEFGKETQIISIESLMEGIEKDAFAHGGGDALIVDTFYNAIEGIALSDTDLTKSIESHLMALTAEKSRLSGKEEKVHR